MCIISLPYAVAYGSRTQAVSVNTQTTNYRHNYSSDQPPPAPLSSRPPRHQFSHRKLQPEDLVDSAITPILCRLIWQ
jgi:hypothetical protein